MSPPSDQRVDHLSHSTKQHLPELLQAALESAGEAVVVTDLSGRIVFANPAFERITGWNRAEAIGQTPRILKSGQEPSALYEEIWQTVSAGQTWNGSFTNRRKDGTIYRVEQTIAPVLDAEGRKVGYVSVHEDVTDRVELEQKLREITEQKLQLLQKEADTARAVQQQLYPREAPELPGLDIAGRTVTASELGGDYFDFLPLPDGRLAVAVGDVSGHGIGPALVMTTTRAWLRALLSTGQPLHVALRRLNRALHQDLHRGMFVTLFVSIIEPHSRSVISVGAGHVAHLLRADGTLETLPSTGLLLGMSKDTEFSPLTEQLLAPGDTLLLTTDGVVESESPDRELFGVERMADVARAAITAGGTAADIVDALHTGTLQYSQRYRPADDVTVVVVRCID
ncbi:MAG: SpoIIE family protein phosphatase [Planctomycetota bacterium]|jgi:sigma-B regulation protein RsbU (phosphoserine phosphatase)